MPESENPREQKAPPPEVPPTVPESTSSTTVASSGKRQAFRDIRRQLEEGDLASKGVQKLLLDDLERAEAECEVLQGYIDRYHESDKRAAVLEERLKTQTALEILFGTGLALGSAIIGLAPSFWDQSYRGPIALIIGILLVGGSTLARVLKK